MKHYLLSVANGLHTPPCNNSHGKSSHFFNFRFSLFTPLLVLFLLIVGNSPAWGGWRFQGQNGTDENWGRGDNMTQVGSSDIWYYKISNLNNDIQFKINNGNWDGEKQKYWSANHDDQNRGNVQLEDAKDGDIEGKNRFKYSRNTNFGKDVARDLYIFVKGDANNPSTNDRVWAIAVTPGSGAISKAYSLRGDLWLNDDDADGGWASVNDQRNPVFVNMTNDVAAQLSYLIPIPSGSNAMKSRFTLISAGSPTNENKLETSTSTSSLGNGDYSENNKDGGKYRLTIPANGGSYPTVKRIVLDYYASGKLRARLEDYIVKRDGWHLYIDDKYMGAMSNSGSFTVEGLASGTHTMYIANYSHNSINSSVYDPYSDNGGKIHAQQWFGGLFIDMNPAHSNVTFEDKKAYYNSGDSYFGPQTYPIADTKNARGKFKINEKSDVEFTFDGGVITINAVDHGATPEPLSGDYYVFGAGGTNWVTGWTRSVEANKMTITDGVATKTFYNVSGQGLEFKIHKGETEYNNSLLLEEISENNSHLIKRVWKNGTNIDFSISDINIAHKADVTVHFDGEHIWLTAVPSPETIAGSEWYIMGSGNVGTEHSLDWGKSTQKSRGNEHKMTIQDGVATITYTGVNGDLSFKVFRGSDEYEINDFYYDASASSGIICTDQDGNDNINVNLNNKNISIHWDGTKIWTTEPPTPSGVTFDGSEYFFWNTNVSSWGTVLAGKDRTQFLQFKNTTTNATAHTKLAFLWEQTNTGGDVEGILAAKAPSGEWHQVRHCRVNADDWNEGAILGTGEGSTDWIDLQEGNYMYKESGSIKFTTRTAEHFKFFLSGTVALAGGADEFNPWNGNGTLYTDRITKTLEAGIYKFKINPDMTIYDSRGGVNKWTNEFNWDDVDITNSSDNISLRKGTDNGEIHFTLTLKSEVTIACDGSKVTVVAVPAQQYTVTFNTDGGSTIAPIQVIDGSPVARPADPTKAGYTFVKWQLGGSDYYFSSAVNSNITLNAVWAYKSIESISLNESEHMTWVGNSDFTLTPTYSPSDVITKAVTWSSNNESVATVNNGIVHAVGAGTATITCTVTDQYDTKKTATCEVTVAACEMTTNDLYTMTVTSYKTYSGDEAILTNLWNESDENDGPAGMTITRFAFQKKEAGTILYAYDDNGTVKVKEDASGDDVQWLLIPTGETYTPSWNNGNSCQLYYIKNKATGAYMPRGSEGVNTGNSEWFYSVTNTNATNTATDHYKWFFVYENENQRCIYVKSGVGGEKKSSYKLHTSNQYNSETNINASFPILPVGRTADINDFAKSYNNTNDFNYNTDPNPNYLASQMNGSYYRMKENATVRANLTAPLVSGAVITVRLYVDAATSVQLTKADGTEVATINLTADTEFEYSYTVNNASPLLGESAFVIKATDNHAGIASIKVTRTLVANPSNPELSWETDLSGGVTQSALGSTFQHVASSTLSLGAIHYASSNEAVATVAADGTVTPHSAGTTTITATIAAEGCYKEASISYNITLTEASLQELIDATPVGETLTLTHDYDENAVINKAITLDAQGHTIDDLTVEYAGDLTLSSELTVRDFTIWAKAGNTSTPAASGQVRNASKLNINRNAYFLYTVDPSGHVQYCWYDFTVPFPINIVSGIKGIQDGVLKEDFRNGVDYAVMEYFGEKQAQGQYPYKKFSGVMQPNKLYTITLDDDYNYNTLRMQKTADGALVASDEVTLNAYAGGDAINENWNGVGNGTLHHADAGISGNYIQVY